MDRAALVHRVNRQLVGRPGLRVQLFAVIALSGLMSFGVSFALLRMGVDAMSFRYGAAAVFGYGAFVVLFRVWLGWRGTTDLDPQVDPGLFDLHAGAASDTLPDFFGGGRSGGGGASGSWGDSDVSRAVPAGLDRGPSRPSTGIDLDLDDLGWVLILCAVAFAGAVAVGYVIVAAPILIAEVMVDAAIVSTVYRRVAATNTRHWAATIVRRTWAPAAILTASLIAGGYALQKLAPDAKSIGPAVATILSPR